MPCSAFEARLTAFRAAAWLELRAKAAGIPVGGGDLRAAALASERCANVALGGAALRAAVRLGWVAFQGVISWQPAACVRPHFISVIRSWISHFAHHLKPKPKPSLWLHGFGNSSRIEIGGLGDSDTNAGSPPTTGSFILRGNSHAALLVTPTHDHRT